MSSTHSTPSDNSLSLSTVPLSLADRCASMQQLYLTTPGQLQRAEDTVERARAAWTKLPKNFDPSLTGSVLHFEEVLKYHNRKRGMAKRFLVVTLKGIHIYSSDGKAKRFISHADADRLYVEEKLGCVVAFHCKRKEPLKLKLLRPAGEGLEKVLEAAGLVQMGKPIPVDHVSLDRLERRLRCSKKAKKRQH